MTDRWEHYEMPPDASTTLPPCRRCGEPANTLVYLPGGCAAFPCDRRQWLCWQHHDRLDNVNHAAA